MAVAVPATRAPIQPLAWELPYVDLHTQHTHKKKNPEEDLASVLL